MLDMRIGIFDSGLGGLVIAKEVFKRLPAYDFLYLGDTKNVPYGARSQKEILALTTKALKYLFAENCKLVIIACNTSSAKALRQIQQKFLPSLFPDRKVLGVIVPTLENIPKNARRVGVIATSSTCRSHAYKRELAKINPKAAVYEQAAPQLVPFIENDAIDLAKSKLNGYLKPLLKKNIDTLVLGCTHYPILKREIKKAVGKRVKVLSQEEIIPAKLADYLKRHKEIEKVLLKGQKKEFTVTKQSSQFNKVSKLLFGKKINLKLVKY